MAKKLTRLSNQSAYESALKIKLYCKRHTTACGGCDPDCVFKTKTSRICSLQSDRPDQRYPLRWEISPLKENEDE